MLRLILYGVGQQISNKLAKFIHLCYTVDSLFTQELVIYIANLLYRQIARKQIRDCSIDDDVLHVHVFYTNELFYILFRYQCFSVNYAILNYSHLFRFLQSIHVTSGLHVIKKMNSLKLNVIFIISLDLLFFLRSFSMKL
jgi:hypothetical protein